MRDGGTSDGSTGVVTCRPRACARGLSMQNPTPFFGRHEAEDETVIPLDPTGLLGRVPSRQRYARHQRHNVGGKALHLLELRA